MFTRLLLFSKKNKMKRFYIYLGFFFILYSAAFAQSPVRFEAENGVYSGLEIHKDSSASMGSYLEMGNGGEVSWNVKADKSAWCNLVIRYRALEGEKEEIIVRNGYAFPVGFEMSKNWNLCIRKTFLKKGVNKIAIRKSWAGIDLDFLEVSPADLKPELSQLNNIFYKEHPYDITIKVNRYGYKLKYVTSSNKVIPFESSIFDGFEDAVNVKMHKKYLKRLSEGKQKITFHFDGGYKLDFNLDVKTKRQPAHFTIIAPDVEHGNSVIFILPAGKVLLVDCAKAWVRDDVVIPFLQRHGIKKIDYMILTHYHGDHDSDDKGMKIRNMFGVKNFYDYKSFSSGDSLNLEGVKLKVLNSFNDGTEENSRSLSFKMEYNGFVYVHGADIYAGNQLNILKKFPEDIKAHVYFANHHFHGSANTEYLRAVDPAVVLLQAEKAIYARSTYMVNFLERVVPYLKSNKKRFVDVLPALEVGTSVIRVNGKDDWTYETYRETGKVVVPFLNACNMED